jgi:ketosteroid isomerase-like protein
MRKRRGTSSGRGTRDRARDAGKKFDVPEVHVWTVEDGKELRFES